MFKKEFNDLLNSKDLSNSYHVNEKVARDFLRLLIENTKVEIPSDLFEEFINATQKVAEFNNHKFVRQSDLFAMLFVEQNKINDFENAFNATMKEAMFKELNIYLEANIEFKDQATIDFENNNISEQQKEQAALLLEWTNKKINELESSIEQVLNGDQLKNELTQNVVDKFYKEKIKELITMMKWHTLGFKIVISA